MAQFGMGGVYGRRRAADSAKCLPVPPACTACLRRLRHTANVSCLVSSTIGYVGTFADQERIRKQEKEREESRRQFEEAKRKASAGAGLRDFSSGTSEALENAFKAETVGLVTRAEFVEKRATIADRLEEEARKRRAAAEDAAMRVRTGHGQWPDGRPSLL